LAKYNFILLACSEIKSIVSVSFSKSSFWYNLFCILVFQASLVRIEGSEKCEGFAALVALEGFGQSVPALVCLEAVSVLEHQVALVAREGPFSHVRSHVACDRLPGVEALGTVSAAKVAPVLVLQQVVDQRLVGAQHLVAHGAQPGVSGPRAKVDQGLVLPQRVSAAAQHLTAYFASHGVR
jgi:hypothetical protein